MNYLYVLLIAILLYAGFVLIHHEILTHRNLPKITQTDVELGSGSVLRYIAAGDSTAYGEGASSQEQTYGYKIAQQLGVNHRVLYKNIGVPGAKTQDVLNTQLQQIVAYNPDIITVSIGANDVTHLVSDQNIYKNYSELVKQLESQTHAKIYITNIVAFKGTLLPVWYRWVLNSKAKTLNKQIENLADARTTIINIHDSGWDNDKSSFAADQFHPSDQGYEIWSKVFSSKIQDR